MNEVKRKGAASGSVLIKRAYEKPAPADGYRVLIDGLWPRGVTKQALRLDEWLSAIAPSAALRQWFGHDPARWSTFVARYRKELDAPERQAALAHLRRLAAGRTITLVYAARDELHNHAIAIRSEISAPRRRGS